jgi:NAD(P)-dependent dehydrogenase (short-subunit alcohol dehydrogenase family)
MLADLSSKQAVRDLAKRFLDTHDRLDVLLNNAGAIYTTRQNSVDGIELTWALNHLSYFLLTHLLLDALKAAPAARVVNVSSGAHLAATRGINFDDVQFARRYSGFGAYAQSKLANIMFTYALARRLAGTHVTANALHPGAVATNFGQNNAGFMGKLWKLFARFTLSAEQGAQTSIYLVSSPKVDGVSGKYFDKCKPVRSSGPSNDEVAQERLWAMSEEMVRVA